MTCYNCNEEGHMSRDCPTGGSGGRGGGRGRGRGRGGPRGGRGGTPRGGGRGGMRIDFNSPGSNKKVSFD